LKTSGKVYRTCYQVSTNVSDESAASVFRMKDKKFSFIGNTQHNTDVL